MKRAPPKKYCHLAPLHCSSSLPPYPGCPAAQLLSSPRSVRSSPPGAGSLPPVSPNPLRTTLTGRVSVQADAFKQKAVTDILSY